ncbi:MAG: hypothetical protein GF350_02815 [Chitinivibrionales bacterium]|nr:hypothetical protein [Chitinivibrionales bacterium]
MKFIAHRGSSRAYPENSIDAFEAVMHHPENNKSLVGFECDIQMTSDNQVPVFHDTTITGTNGNAVDVGSVGFELLRSLYRREKKIADLDIPLLDTVLALTKHATSIILEIKDGAYDRDCFMELLCRSLQLYGPGGDITLSSFSPEIVHHAISATARFDVRYAFVFTDWDNWELLSEQAKDSLHFIHPHYSLLLETPEKIGDCRVPVQCWTVNDPGTIQACIDAPIHGAHLDAIITDNLALCREFSGR